MLDFNEIPRNLRVPFVYAEFDASGAVTGASAQPYRQLLIGQRIAGAPSEGLAPSNAPVRLTSAAQAKSYYGEGSMLEEMADAAFLNAPTTETWAIALDDAVGAAKATGSITLAGAATEAGTLSALVAGKRVRAGVVSGATAAQVAAALVAAAAEVASLQVTAAVDGVDDGKVIFTARHGGALGNDIDLRLNYYSGESVPAGLTATVAAFAGGATDPDIADAIAAMGDDQYHVIATPYHDDASLDLIEAELRDRWGPLRMIEGIAASAAPGTHSELATLGEARNSPHSTIRHIHRQPITPWRAAAGYAAVLAFHGEIDPARPFQTLEIKGELAPAKADLFTLAENNLLLFSGISTFTVDSGGLVRIQRAITTYQTSPNGAEDVAYLDVNTPLTLGYLRFDFRNYILRKYPRHKLADDGTPLGRGQAVMTPAVGRAEAVARFQVWQDLGLVEDLDGFKAGLIVERDLTDRNRLNWFMPPNLINQFRVGAAQIGFIL